MSRTSSEPTVGDGVVEDWYHQHFDHLVRLGVLSCGDHAMAEDAVQEVFADLYRRPKTLHEGVDPLPYLRVSVLNRCRSRLRRRTTGRRAALRLLGDGFARDDVEHDALSRATVDPIVAAVRALPDRQRQHRGVTASTPEAAVRP